MGSHIDVVFVYISGHAKVGDLAHFFITHQYVPSGQITMDDLNNKKKIRYILPQLDLLTESASGKRQLKVES